MTDPRLIARKTDCPIVAATWQGTAARLQHLVEGAASYGGEGMSAISSETYGSMDWHLVKVCLHEAAHAVVAKEFAVTSRIEIASGAGIGNGTCWLGAAVLKMPAHVHKMIGLAGSAAAEIANYSRRYADVAWVHRHLTWPGMMSEKDKALAAGFTAADTEQVHALVLRTWPAIAATARRVLHEQLQVNGQRGLQ